MTFISVFDIARQQSRWTGSRGGKRLSGKILTIGINVGGKSKNGSTRQALTIRLSADLAKEARLLIGDRVDVLFDKESGLGLVKRVQTGGYATTVAGMATSSVKPGAFYPTVVKLTYYDGMPFIAERHDCENVTVTNEGIMFTLPDSVTYKAPKS